MNFRRIFLALAIMALPIMVSAQNERPRNWIIGAGGGLNIGYDGKDYLGREDSHSGNGTAVDAYIGKYFNNTLGARVGYQSLGLSDQYIIYGKDDYSYIHGDILFRLWDFLVPYVHGGYAKVESGKFAGGAGLMTPIKLGRRVSVVPDLKFTAFDGSIFPEGEGFGRNVSGTLGLQLALGKVGTKAVEEVVEPIPVPVIAPKPEPKPEPKVEPEPEPEPVKPTVEDINKTFRADALFDFDSSKLRPESVNILDKAVDWLNEFPTVTGVIEGHTDSVGTDAYNQGLSERRAKAVYDYLVSKGIDASRLSWKGFGESKPVATNETAEGRQLNRRIVLVLDEE